MDKPFFMDEKEFQALKESQENNTSEEVKPEVEEPKDTVVEEPVKEEQPQEEKVEEPKTEEKEESPVLEETKEDIKMAETPIKEEKAIEEAKEEKHEIVESKLEKPVVENEKSQEKKGFVMDLKMFTTIFCCIIVAYLFLALARNLYFGFKYYDYAHGNNGTNTVEPQK